MKVEVTDLKAPNATNSTVADATGVQVKLWISNTTSNPTDTGTPDFVFTGETITNGVLSVPLPSESDLITDLYGATEDGLMFRFGPDTCYTDTARTTTAAVNDAVAGVTDLSGNGYHATQSVLASRPILRQDVNGKYYLEFDGTDDFLEVSAANMTRNIGYITMAGGGKITDASSGGAVFYASGAAGDTITRASSMRCQSATEFGITGRRLDADTYQTVVGTPPTGNFSSVGYIDYTNASAEIRVNKANLAGPATFQTAGSTSDTASNIVRIGATGSTYFDGDIYSVIVVTRELTAQELIDTENYLYNTTGQMLQNAGNAVLGVAKWTVLTDDYFFPIETTIEEDGT